MRLDSCPSKWHFVSLSELKCRDSSQAEHLRWSQSSTWSAVAAVTWSWGVASESNKVYFELTFTNEKLLTLMSLTVTLRSWLKIQTSGKKDWSCYSIAVGRILSFHKHFSPSFYGTVVLHTGMICVITPICCLTFCWLKTLGNITESTMH